MAMAMPLADRTPPLTPMRATAAKARVREPRPGPISRTVSWGRTPALLTMRRTVPASWTKFCPSVLVGRMPSAWDRPRTSVGPRRPAAREPAEAP